MALNATGPISLAGATTGESIAVELGLSSSGEITLNDTAVRDLAGVATGAIVMPTDFWGASAISGTNYVQLTLKDAPYMVTYNYSTSTGWGSKFSDPNVTGWADGFGDDGVMNSDFTALARTVSSGIEFNAWGHSISTGWGSRFSNPSSGGYPTTGSSQHCVFTRDDDHVIFGWSNNAPQLFAYNFSSTTGWGSYVGAPTGINNLCRYTRENRAESYHFAAIQTTPAYLRAYAWTGSAWGTQYSPTGSHNVPFCIDVNQADTAVAASFSNAPYTVAWQWSNSTQWGSVYSALTSQVPGSADGKDCAFNSDDSVFISGYSGKGPQAVGLACAAWNWDNSTGWGSRFTAMTGWTYKDVHHCDFTSDGAQVIMSTSAWSTGQTLIAWNWDNATGWGSKLADPSTTMGYSPSLGDGLSLAAL